MTTADCLQRALLTKTHSKPAHSTHGAAIRSVALAAAIGVALALVLVSWAMA